MKKLVVLFLAMVIALNVVLVGCGKEIATVDVNIPSVLVGDLGDFDEEEFLAQNEDVKGVKVNDDMSITLTIPEDRHKKMVSEMREGLEASFNELIESENTVYIKDIVYSDDLRKVNIIVDKEGYESSFDFTHLLVGFLVGTYQVYAGHEFYTEVIIEDKDTGHEINSVIYPDALEEEVQ